MSRINETHPLPARHASVGHRHARLLGIDSAPRAIAHDNPGGGPAQQRRRNAKAAVKQRRQEIAQGAGFLRRLTTARGN